MTFDHYFSASSAAGGPHTLTILCTYQCTAACAQCCFESSPRVQGRLSRETIFERIQEAKKEFESLQLVVFSGGEAFILKQDLFDAVALATSLGLLTRIVSNGSWAKTKKHAETTAASLLTSGITEINISTGLEHLEWVPMTSVVNAAVALTTVGIQTLITVEMDTEASSCFEWLMRDEEIQTSISERNLKVQRNSWMPFSTDATERAQSSDKSALRSGCNQIFGTVVVTPHDNLSACCGLTLEHIPEMRLGTNSGNNMRELYNSQYSDFLKYWIHTDGPYAIIERILGEKSTSILEGVVHICQACAVLHQNPLVRQALAEKFESFVPEVLTRFELENELNRRSGRAQKEVVASAIGFSN